MLLFHRALSGHLQVGRKDFGYLIAYGEHRVQGGHRFLEYHRDLSAPQSSHLLPVKLQEVFVSEEYSAISNRIGREYPHYGEGRDALAASALAGKTEDLGFVDSQS